MSEIPVWCVPKPEKPRICNVPLCRFVVALSLRCTALNRRCRSYFHSAPVDLVTQLYGAAFWGCIFTGITAAILIGGVVFVAVWHVGGQSMLLFILSKQY